MKPVFVLMVCSLLGACAQRGLREYEAFQLRDGDFGLIAKAALDIVERSGPVRTFVVPPSLDPRALAALRRLRPVVPEAQLAGTALPAGYFRLQDFSFDGDVAAFAGDLGPTGCADGCGKNLSVPFILRGDDWFNPSYKIVDYSQRREVVPVTESR